MRRFCILLLTSAMMLLGTQASAFAFPMWVSCYGYCGQSYNALEGNAVCSDPTYYFTGEDFAMAGTPTFAPGSLVTLTNIDTLDDDYGASVTVLVNDCHYGYTRPDVQSAGFGMIQDYAAGVAYVDADVIRCGWDGLCNATTDQYGNPL